MGLSTASDVRSRNDASSAQPSAVHGPVFDASSGARAYRRGATVEEPRYRVLRGHFHSRHAGRLLHEDRAWTENLRFTLPAFLPRSRGPWRDVVILLNGLNDGTSRKFFPWAASLAAAGTPVVIFPIAFLLHRRPRAWSTPQAISDALRQRLEVCTYATPFNAVSSLRIATQPLSVLCDVLQTAHELRDFAAQLSRGSVTLEADERPFAEGCRAHLLGYSLGGYLALALRLLAPEYGAARTTLFCSGAALQGMSSARVNLVSPFICDEDAAARLSECLLDERSAELLQDPLAGLLRELLVGATDALRAQVRRAAADIQILGGVGDTVTPVVGMTQNLGRCDLTINIGIHEFPFNVKAHAQPVCTREILHCDRVASALESGFSDFVAAIRDHFAGPWQNSERVRSL